MPLAGLLGDGSRLPGSSCGRPLSTWPSVSPANPAASDTHQRPSPLLHRQGGEGRIVPSSFANRRAADRATRRQCRAATRRTRRGRECTAWPYDGRPGRIVPSARGCRDRSRGGRSWRRARGQTGHSRHGCIVRTAFRASVSGRQAAKAPVPCWDACERIGGCRRVQRCGSNDCPSGSARRAARLSSLPMARVGRASARQRQATGASRLADRGWRGCQDLPRKESPQGDHLLARGCWGRLTTGRAERRALLRPTSDTRLAAGPAAWQITRKSGLRRSHSHANPRADKASNLRYASGKRMFW